MDDEDVIEYMTPEEAAIYFAPPPPPESDFRFYENAGMRDPFYGQVGYNPDAFGGTPKPTIASETPGSDAYIPGINTEAFTPQYGTTQGAPYTYDNTGVVSGVGSSSGSGSSKVSGLVKQITDLLGSKTGSLGGIGDLLMSLLALKYATSGGMKPQTAGYKGSVNMALKAVQPKNVPAQRAYGEGAVGQPYKATTYAAQGGLMGLAAGGLRDGAFIIPADVVSHLGNGSSEAGLKLLAKKFGAVPIKGDGDGMSDSIDTTIEGQRPAKVANEEAIVSPEKVTELGGGNPKKGAKVLYAMMDRVRKARTGTKKQGKQIKPEKFMPGGIARYAGGGAVAFNGTTGSSVKTPTTGSSTSSSLSEWAGPYVTNMLSQANALGNQPYQAYTGDLTAGTSPLQQQAFRGYGNWQMPASMGQAAQTLGNLGNRFSGLSYTPTQFANQFQSPGKYQTGQFANQFQAPAAYQTGQFANQFQGPSEYRTGSFNTGLGPVGSVESYMNPYTQNVTDIEAREARRQAEIDRVAAAARLTQAGAFGGSRQAIMESEGLRNLQTRIGDITSRGLNAAYDRALAQRLSESQASMEAQKAREASRQFGAGQALTAAQLRAQYGLSAQQAAEASRQFGAGQALNAAQLRAQYGLSAQQAAEASRQFGAGQAMTASQLRAQYGLSAQQAAEASRQFGANYGLQGLQGAMQAAQGQGQLGAQQAQFGLQSLRDQLAAGQQQSAIEQQSIDAQRAQFEEARAYPYKQLQFLQSMLSGLPISTYASTPNTSQYDEMRAYLDAILGPLRESGTQTGTTPK